MNEAHSARMSIPEIATRLHVGRQAVYKMLERGIIPGVRFGHRWVVTRYAYERWEQTCGEQPVPAALRYSSIHACS